MKGRVIALGAGVVTAIVIAGILAVQAKRETVAHVETKALGPRNEAFAFAVAPTGRASAANDCVVCHSIDKDGPMRSAPTLWGIVGAPKARAEWFAYSLPLRKKGGVWSDAELDKYLANPSGFLPGTLKTLPPIADPARRQQLISFLKTLQG